MQQTLSTPLINEQGTAFGPVAGCFILAWGLSVVAGSIVGGIGMIAFDGNAEKALMALILFFGSAIASIPYVVAGIIGLLIARKQTHLPASWRRKRFFLLLKLIVVAVFGLIALAAYDPISLVILPVWGIPGLIIEMLMLKDRHFEPQTIS